MKRFTETTKWDDPWFRGLDPIEKLVFLFLVENCNNAGFYEIDLPAMSFKTGLSGDQIEGGIKGLIRGIVGAPGWLWVRRFLKHQKNAELNPDNGAHKQILSLLSEQAGRFNGCSEFREFIAPYMGLLRPIGTGTGNGNRQGKKLVSFRNEDTEQLADAQRDRLCALFNRRASTPWSDKETKAFKSLLPIAEEDLSVVEAYYRSESRKQESCCRRDIGTLLNNFPGEIDRARGWQRKAKLNGAAHQEKASKF